VGQAKKRGSFEERKNAAVEKNAADREALREARRKHWESLTPTERKLAVQLLALNSSLSQGN